MEYVKFVDKEQHKTKRRQKEKGFDIDVLRSAAELIRMLLIIGISTFLGMLSNTDETSTRAWWGVRGPGWELRFGLGWSSVGKIKQRTIYYVNL